MAQAWNKIHIDINLISSLYFNERMSCKEIANKFNVSDITIQNKLRENGFKLRTNSEAHKGLQVAQNNPNWKGGRRLDSQGYPLIRIGINRYEREHRVIAERNMGRPLKPNETIHHKNRKRLDNAPSNIAVLASQSEHMKIHMITQEARKRGTKGANKRWAAKKAIEGVG